MTDLVPVRVPCPSGQHPDGDSVSLKPRLGFAGGFEARRSIDELRDGATHAEVIGLMLEVYVRHGVAEWTLHDAEGEPIEVTRKAIQERPLDDLDTGLIVGDVADGLYSPVVVAPLVAAASKSSQAMPAELPTSAMTASSPSPRKRPKRSSTSTTLTDDTGPTSA
jgi:hypothetical protein